jgi:diadenosine tetraphosphate (Ap4A) HIT family hydrolase
VRVVAACVAISDDPLVEGCLASDLAEGRMPLPGGVIYEGHSWIVEHCVGPFGVGTLLVKSKRHVTRVSQLKVERFAERARNAF